VIAAIFGLHGSAQAQVFVDPDGPAGKQYSDTLDEARAKNSGTDPSTAVPGSGQGRPPLFGEGVEQAGGAGGGGGNGADGGGGGAAGGEGGAEGDDGAALADLDDGDGGTPLLLLLVFGVVGAGAFGGFLASRGSREPDA
jgi:hypothetical protein